MKLLGITVFVSLCFSISAYNPCCSFPCQHNGVCVGDGDEYSCDCTRTGYYGKNCETPYWGTWLRGLIKPSQETANYIMTHFSWLWYFANNIGFLQDMAMSYAYHSRINYIRIPHVHTSDHEYATMEAHYNRSYYARTLPPVPKGCPTPFGVAGKKVPPSAEELAEKFLKRTEFITDPQNTSLLFTFFAQHFTHCFFKTEYHRHPGMTWGQHGVDSSHIYGQGGERESKLRTLKDGKMKSQIINGEEWPPSVKDADVFMQYPEGVPNEKKFALGHPFYSMLPGLFMYATVWLREHNRVVTILKKIHPKWDDEQLFQTGKNIITAELIKIVIEDYVNHLANYHLRIIYKPEILFGESFPYDNRIHLEFNHVYHWHPFSSDEFNISGTIYTMDESLGHPEIVVKHGMKGFVDSFSRSLAGKMSHHNHGERTRKVSVAVIKHQRELRLQSYNNYRKRFDLHPFTSFEEMTGDKEMTKELEEMYGDVDAVDLYMGMFLEKNLDTGPFPITLLAMGAPYSIRGLLANPISSPEYYKPSTFGGEVGFEIAQTASLEKLFCQNIKGECPLVKFRVPTDLAREARKNLEQAKKPRHDEL